MTLYTETHPDIVGNDASGTGFANWLRGLFRSPLPAAKDIADLSERDLADVGVRRSRTAQIAADLREIDRLGLGWKRRDSRF